MYANWTVRKSSGSGRSKAGADLSHVECLLEIWSLVKIFALVTLRVVRGPGDD